MPKIADFGLARLFSSDNSHISTSIAGTLGYMAPEYIGHGQLSEKVDVYCFGVLVLEIISGTRNNSFDRLDDNTLVSKAWNLHQSALLSQLIDESVEGSDPVSRVARVGLLCTQEVPALRPCMSLLVGMLRHRDFHLPTPSKPPFVHGSSIGDVCEKSDTPLNPNVSFSSLDCSEMYPRRSILLLFLTLMLRFVRAVCVVPLHASPCLHASVLYGTTMAFYTPKSNSSANNKCMKCCLLKKPAD